MDSERSTNDHFTPQKGRRRINLKTEQEIRENLNDIYESPPEQLFDNEYMQGYVKALEWVLEKLQVIKNDTNKSK
jgi:hypothetical protein